MRQSHKNFTRPLPDGLTGHANVGLIALTLIPYREIRTNCGDQEYYWIQTDAAMDFFMKDDVTNIEFIQDASGQKRQRDLIGVSVCPYLGSFADPVTACSYVTSENCCYHVNPATPIKGAHQRVYCLTYRHVACPIFRHEEEIQLRNRSKPGVPKRTFWLPLIVAWTLILITAVLLLNLS